MRLRHGYIDDIDGDDIHCMFVSADGSPDGVATLPRAMWPEADRYSLIRGTYVEGDVDDTELVVAIRKTAVPPKPMTPDQRLRLERAIQILPGGIWEVWTSNSFRRITAVHNGRSGQDGGVLSGTVQRSDNHPDLSMSELELNALCALRNTVAEIIGAKD